MTKTELDEAVALVGQVLTALVATLPTQTGAIGAQLKLACGALAVNIAGGLNGSATATFWSDFANCFEQARLAGADYFAIDQVRAQAERFVPVGQAGIAVANFAVRMSLAEQAQVLAAITFTNRAEIDRYLDLINSRFDTAVTTAADRRDNVAYRALIALRAAVVHDLSTRALPLPQLVALTFPIRFPALTLAQRIYQDGTRVGQLVGENQVVHPAFMPRMIRALSA